MALGADRYATRGDTFVFVVTLALSLVAMSLPPTTRDPIASNLRRTVLWPFLQLQSRSDQLRTSRAAYVAVEAQRDSATLAAGELGEIRAENNRLRALLGLGARLGSGFVAAEVLHQAAPTDRLTVVISAGSKRGVRQLEPVIAPEGLLGIVSNTESATSVVATWAHPEFRASGMASDGSVYGILAPYGSAGGVWMLEMSGVAFRTHIPYGTRILTSGLGGILPRGIPIGTVVGTEGETEWDRTYLVRPAVPPGSVTHVMVLTSSPTEDLRAVFTPDSTKAQP